MKRYFGLQLKRAAKILPYVFVILIITLVSLLIIASALATQEANSEEKTRLRIAVTGDTKGQYVQFFLLAVQNFDDTRFAMEIVELTEEEAREQLMAGKLSAFVILPPDFIERAFYGDIDTAKYVTTAGSQSVAIMVKNEITKLITNMVVYSEKGVYSIPQVFEDYDISEPTNTHINNLSLEYTDVAFSRSNIYVIDELGVSTGVDLLEYYICSIAVILLALIGVAFVTVYVKKDYSLPKLLMSKKGGATTQLLCEYIAHFISLLALLAVLVALVLVFGKGYLEGLNIGSNELIGFSLRLLPVILMFAAFNILVFEISSNIVTAILVHFFGCVAQLYVSGCFYPVYSLPQILQKVANFLPTGIARGYLEGAFLGEEFWLKLLGLLGYTALFFLISVLTRKHKVLRESR